MHLGFAMVETGLTRAKNTVNILFKNVFIICAGILTYYICGFNLMYPGDFNGFIGFAGFGLGAGFDAEGNTPAYASGGYTYWTDFLFQAMFAATAATIVSGAVAERIKLSSFMVFSVIFVAVVYTIAGSWKWGGGWLDGMGFYDFAGSTLVHSVGGWGALIGILFLGPRLGKYTKSGRVTPIPGSSMPSATIGVFLLWLGWFGFNGGSVLSADPSLTSLRARHDLPRGRRGRSRRDGHLLLRVVEARPLDGPERHPGRPRRHHGRCRCHQPVWSAVAIGLIAGGLVVFSVITFDKLKIDDPVGAISVHLVCGIWGTLAVGIFSTNPEHSFVTQLIGVAAYAVFTVACASLIFGVIKATMGLRVSEEEELEGLDLGEHGMHAYDIAPSTGPFDDAHLRGGMAPAASTQLATES